MHIGYILSYIAERYGGPPKSTRALGQAVAAHGVQVSYWGTATSHERLAFCDDPEMRLFEPFTFANWFCSPSLAVQLTQELGSIDLVDIQELWSYPQLAAAKVAREQGKPYIITPRGELEPWRIRRKGLLKFAKKVVYLKLVGTRMLNGAACLHAVTACEIEGFRRAGYRGPVAVVPNGIDVDRFSRLPDPQEAETHWPVLKGRRVVLFLSRLSSEKGLDELIPAWGRVVRGVSYDDAVLVLAGPDDRGYRLRVERMVARRGLGGHVLFTGLVNGTRKMALISRADGYVLPSHSEGFSVSLLENMAAGKAVLVTPGCNFPEIAREGAGLTVPCEAGALAEGVRRLLDMSTQERMAMGQRAQRLILRDYTWDIVARKMLTVYDCVVNGRPVPEHPQLWSASPKAVDSLPGIAAVPSKSVSSLRRPALSKTDKSAHE